MSPAEKALARILFQREIYRRDGQAFEDFFSRIMEYHNSNFNQIKPQGPIGDRKNDGYDRTTGTYHQVYAPEDVKETVSTAVTKARKDFTGMKAFWEALCPIRSYRFVYNDKYQGVYPTIEAELAAIKRDHNLEECGTLAAKDLEDIALNLTDDKIIAVIGFVPDPTHIQQVRFSVLDEVIRHVMSQQSPVTPGQIFSAPNFEEKIKFNGLSKVTGALLATGSFQRGAVDEYFSLNSAWARQSLRDTFSQGYASALAAIPDGQLEPPARGDLIFFEILQQALPPEATKAHQDAALVLMAYYFESCDIFEDPGINKRS